MSWEPVVKKGTGPIYSAICDALELDVAKGRLKPAEKLPPHRDLAYRLGVTVGTIGTTLGLLFGANLPRLRKEARPALERNGVLPPVR